MGRGKLLRFSYIELYLKLTLPEAEGDILNKNV